MTTAATEPIDPSTTALLIMDYQNDILGMLPAALALGEGGEQNAPLGRAVIGGLVIATFVTLLIVPLIYTVLRQAMPNKHTLDERLQREEEEGHHP